MDNPITILDAKALDQALQKMTRDILEQHEGGKKLNLIGIQTRGVHIAKRIQENIRKAEGIIVPTSNIDITLYRDDWTEISNHPVVQATDLLFSVDGKEIILVDDVLFTGRTTRAAMDAIIDFGRPSRIESAVLVDRGHRELPIQANYVGKVVETDATDMVNVLMSEHDGEDLVVLQPGEKTEEDSG